MTKYREILRLHSHGVSQCSIAESLSCSRNIIAKFLSRAKELSISWPLKSETTDASLDRIFYLATETARQRRLPDYDHIHSELAKQGVTLKLLWNEYCEECVANRELPLMYSQYCYHYQQHSLKTKATMHIPRHPGEQIEVDWAGQTISVVDRITGEMKDVYMFVGVLSALRKGVSFANHRLLRRHGGQLDNRNKPRCGA